MLPGFFPLGKYTRIKDIPGSKTILIALAWGVVTALLPSLSISKKINWGTLLIFTWTTGMVFVRTAFFDVLDMQGDRIVGKQTIPLLLGEARTMRLLNALLLLALLILILSSIFKLYSSLGYVLTICPILIGVVLKAHLQGSMLPGTRLEFLIESHFILAGILSLIWSTLYR
jgi:4-hydroxy-3-methylbut-2-enyl diphosphate reductase